MNHDSNDLFIHPDNIKPNLESYTGAMNKRRLFSIVYEVVLNLFTIKSYINRSSEEC